MPYNNASQVLVESELHKDKVFVGISNLMTWSGTQPSKPKRVVKEGEEAEEEEPEEVIDEDDAENPDRREPLEVFRHLTKSRLCCFCLKFV